MDREHMLNVIEIMMERSKYYQRATKMSDCELVTMAKFEVYNMAGQGNRKPIEKKGGRVRTTKCMDEVRGEQ